MITLHFVYEGQGQKGTSILRVDNTKIVAEVARQAIRQAEAKAELPTAADPVLREIHSQEAARVRDILVALIPELGLEAIEEQEKPSGG